MAPEQLDKTSPLSIQTDVYLLGALLFSILHGQPPVSGESIAEIISKTKTGALSDGEEHIAISLESVLLKALSLVPQDRYISVLDLRNEVLSYRQGFATKAEKASFIKQSALLYKRHKTISHVILLSLIIIVCLTLSFISHIRDSERTAIRAQKNAEELLLLYKNEKNLSAEMTKGVQEAVNSVLTSGKLDDEVDKLIMLSTRKLSSDKNYEVAKTFIYELLKQQPDNIDAWQHLGFISFIQLNFKNAAFALAKSPHKDCLEIAELSRKYAEQFRQDLDINDLAELFNLEMPKNVKWIWCRENILRYHSLKHSPEEHAKLVRLILLKLNPKAKINYDFNSQSKKLSLVGSVGIKTISLNRTTILDNLIEELDISELGPIKGIDKLKNVKIIDN